MANPLEQVRADLGVSIREAAAMAGVSYWSWHHSERYGAPVPRKVREALFALGYDGEAIAREQRQWQEQEALRLRRALAARAVGGGAA